MGGGVVDQDVTLGSDTATTPGCVGPTPRHTERGVNPLGGEQVQDVGGGADIGSGVEREGDLVATTRAAVMTVAGATGGNVVAGAVEDEVGAGAVVSGEVGAGIDVAVVADEVGVGAVEGGTVTVVDVVEVEVVEVEVVEIVEVVAVDGVVAVVDAGATSTWREQPATSTPSTANHATTLRCRATGTLHLHLHCELIGTR